MNKAGDEEPDFLQYMQILNIDIKSFLAQMKVLRQCLSLRV